MLGAAALEQMLDVGDHVNARTREGFGRYQRRGDLAQEFAVVPVERQAQGRGRENDDFEKFSPAEMPVNRIELYEQ
jgi:hypothetical protein